MIDPAVLRAMLNAGCTADQIVAVAEEAARAEDEKRAHKRAMNAERQRRCRARHAMSRVTGVSNGDTPTPDKEGPRTPKEINPNPIPPSPPKGGSSPTDQIEAALRDYSEMAARAGLAIPRDINGGRRQKLGALLRRHGIEVWREALATLEASAFCRGENDRGWRADLDFLLQAKSFARLLEGHYSDRAPKARGSPPARAVPSQADVFRMIGERLGNGQTTEDLNSAREAVSYLPAVRTG